MKKRLLLLQLSFSIFFSASALAVPPFNNCGAEPSEYLHWDILPYTSFQESKDSTQWEAPGIELDYGAFPNTHLHLLFAYGHHLPKERTAKRTKGLIDTEVGILYRFIEETETRPQVSIYPLLEIPTGNVKHNLGNGQYWTQWPLLIQKSFGPWTTYGGVGYAINRAKDKKNYYFGGWLIQRKINNTLSMVSEIYSQGAQGIDEGSYTVINMGGIINLTKNLTLLFCMGKNIGGTRNIQGSISLDWVIDTRLGRD